MKNIIKIPILLIIILLAISTSGQDKPESNMMQEEYIPDAMPARPSPGEPQPNSQTKPDEQKKAIPEDENTDLEDDDLPYQPYPIPRKLFQKKLAPLSNREKVTWAFRMADSNLFL